MSQRCRSLLFVLALTSTAPAAQALLFASDEKVARQAEAIFAQMKEQIPISANPRARAVVECVAQSVVAQLDGPHGDLDWEVVLFEQPSANAFAMPGGKIGVHTGIFQVARTTGQLAAVIGHEVAHVTARHAVKRANRKTLTSGALAVISGVIGDGGITSQLASSALSLGAELGLNRPYDRGQEAEADIMGLEYMADAGFDPRQSLQLWKRMGELQSGAPPEFLSTHPSDETRMDKLVGHLSKALVRYNAARQAGIDPDCM